MNTGAGVDTCLVLLTCTATVTTRDTRAPRAGRQTHGDRVNSSCSLLESGQQITLSNVHFIHLHFKIVISMQYCSSGQAVIDVDGPGPVPPSLVTCDLDSGEVVTSVGHTRHGGHQSGWLPGSWVLQSDHPLLGGRQPHQSSGSGVLQVFTESQIRL